MVILRKNLVMISLNDGYRFKKFILMKGKL